MCRNALISPVTVPSNPSNGASVTSVSITVKKRPARFSSIPAANCSAPSNEPCECPTCSRPWRITRTTGSSEPSAIFVAAVVSLFSSAARICISFCGSRFMLSRHHQNARSPTTATATSALMRIGHITGPPLRKNSRTMFAIIIYFWFRLKLQFVSNARLKQPCARVCRQTPVIFNKLHRRVVEEGKPRRLLHLNGRDVARVIAAKQKHNRPLLPALHRQWWIRRLRPLAASACVAHRCNGRRNLHRVERRRAGHHPWCDNRPNRRHGKIHVWSIR